MQNVTLACLTFFCAILIKESVESTWKKFLITLGAMAIIVVALIKK